MKILLTIATTLAAFTSVSAAYASETAGGHYEWQNRVQLGPNKSNLPPRVRVWVKDDQASITNCGMMMPGNRASHSKS